MNADRDTLNPTQNGLIKTEITKNEIREENSNNSEEEKNNKNPKSKNSSAKKIKFMKQTFIGNFSLT